MGAPKISGGMSLADRESILEKENEYARIRDEEQREFLNIQEQQRMAREESQRSFTKQEEAARLEELERQETEGAEVSETLAEPQDVDTTMADMFASLAYGTEFIGQGEEDDDYMRPE
jgi:membrane protein involved in colicin uptake